MLQCLSKSFWSSPVLCTVFCHQVLMGSKGPLAPRARRASQECPEPTEPKDQRATWDNQVLCRTPYVMPRVKFRTTRYCAPHHMSWVKFSTTTRVGRPYITPYCMPREVNTVQSTPWVVFRKISYCTQSILYEIPCLKFRKQENYSVQCACTQRFY